MLSESLLAREEKSVCMVKTRLSSSLHVIVRVCEHFLRGKRQLREMIILLLLCCWQNITILSLSVKDIIIIINTISHFIISHHYHHHFHHQHYHDYSYCHFSFCCTGIFYIISTTIIITYITAVNTRSPKLTSFLQRNIHDNVWGKIIAILSMVPYLR